MNNLMVILNKTFQCSDLEQIIGIAGFVLTAIQYVAPILLILWGSIDLIKAIIAGKEDEIKKGQQTLLKRVIAALILFLVPFLVSIILGLIGSKQWKQCWNEHKGKGIIDVEQLSL